MNGTLTLIQEPRYKGQIATYSDGVDVVMLARLTANDFYYQRFGREWWICSFSAGLSKEAELLGRGFKRVA